MTAKYRSLNPELNCAPPYCSRPRQACQVIKRSIMPRLIHAAAEPAKPNHRRPKLCAEILAAGDIFQHS